MKKLIAICAAVVIVFVTGVAMANTVGSSTMVFQGTLTDAGGGVYTGIIDMTAGEYYVSGGPGEGISTGGGFDVYAEQGGCAYVQGIGWQSWVTDGATAGTTGQARQIEAIQITLEPRA